METALWIITGIWTLHSAASVIALALVPRLPRHTLTNPPRVAVVVAARDEETRIAATVERLLAQTDVDLRVVVVNDRSVDNTAKILNQLATQNSHLTVEHIDELPAGWLGKCHACHRGAERAAEHAPEWLLFVDADVWLTPHTIARAVASAQRAEDGHITLMPGFARCQGFGKAAVLASLMPFLTRAALCNLRVPANQVGIGGFNLIRTDVYNQFAGHEPLKLEIVDDLYLAVLSSRTGARTRVYRAPEDAEVEYAVSLTNLLAVTKKNNFAIFRFRTFVSIAALLLFAAVWIGALAGPYLFGPPGWAALGALSTGVIAAAIIAKSFGWNPFPALLVPIAHAVLPLMLLNSMTATLLAGGVRWRDTFYPLESLRRGRVR